MSVPSHGTAEHPQRPSLSRSREVQRAGSTAHPHRRSQRASGTCRTNCAWRQLPPSSLSDLNWLLKAQRALCLRQLAKMDEAGHLSADPVRRDGDAAPRTGAALVVSEIEAALRRILLGVEVVEESAELLTVALDAVGGEANHEGEERGP
jgi:hypothetical protein